MVEAFGADDELLVQVIDRDAAPAAGDYGTAVVTRDLADIDRSARGLAWPFSRLRTYRQRTRRRRETIATFTPDLVHYHFLNRFTDRFRRPACTWVVSVHDVEPHQPRLGPLERLVLRDLYRRPDGIIVHHPWIADRLVRDYGVPRNRIEVVPIQVFPIDGPAERSANERPTILCFGALRPNKGIIPIIELMDHPTLAGFDLHVAGRSDPGFEAKVESAAASRPNVVTEIGYVSMDRKDELFRAASVVALPYESFTSQSAVLHDAYGHWRPVVVTDVGALGDTVRHDGTGAVVAPGDTEALVDAIVTMAGPDGDEAAAAARRIAEAQTPTRIAAQLRTAYDRLTAAR